MTWKKLAGKLIWRNAKEKLTIWIDESDVMATVSKHKYYDVLIAKDGYPTSVVFNGESIGNLKDAIGFVKHVIKTGDY